MQRRILAVLGLLLTASAVAACGGSGRPARLGRAAVEVGDTVTRLAWNDHNCEGASHYMSSGRLCAVMRGNGLIPAWSHFPLASHHIRRTGCRLGLTHRHNQSVGRIEYTASSGFLLNYGMAQTPQGWRVVEIGLSPGSPGTYAAPLDAQAVALSTRSPGSLGTRTTAGQEAVT